MTIDERLEFLLKSTESLHETASLQTEQIAELARRSEEDRKRWELLRKVVRAALRAAAENGENGEES